MTPRDRDTLLAIAESADRIADYARQAGPGWTAQPMAVDAIAKRIEQVGELAKRVTPETLTQMPGVDWRAVKATRAILAHDYEELDVGVLEGIVKEHLPGVQAAVRAALAAAEREMT